MKKEILNEINRLLSQLEQDPHLPSNKEVDEGVKEVLEHLKGFVEKRRENGKDSLPPMDKIKRIKERIQGHIAIYSDLYSDSRNKDYAIGLIDGLQTALGIINETFEEDE